MSTDKGHSRGFTTALFFSLHSTCEKVKTSSACYLKCKVNHYQSLLMLPEGKLSIASNPTLGITQALKSLTLFTNNLHFGTLVDGLNI